MQNLLYSADTSSYLLLLFFRVPLNLWEGDAKKKFLCLCQRMVGGIMFPEGSCVHPSVHGCMSPGQTLLARYLEYLLMEFDQTFTINGLWGKD